MGISVALWPLPPTAAAGPFAAKGGLVHQHAARCDLEILLVLDKGAQERPAALRWAGGARRGGQNSFCCASAVGRRERSLRFFLDGAAGKRKWRREALAHLEWRVVAFDEQNSRCRIGVGGDRDHLRSQAARARSFWRLLGGEQLRLGRCSGRWPRAGGATAAGGGARCSSGRSCEEARREQRRAAASLANSQKPGAHSGEPDKGTALR